MLDVKLKTLQAVAEQQSFTKAGEVLSLTQPAVSHHISQLEREFGVRLFIRGKSGLTMTAEGKVVLDYARRISALYDALYAELGGAAFRDDQGTGDS